MKKYFGTAAIVVFSILWGASAYGQEISVEALKSKGATVLSADDAKALLTGATVRYENEQNETQIKLNASGSLDGTSKRRIGARGGSQFTGDWKVTPEGRWCFETVAFGLAPGGRTLCRDILKLGDKYYYATGNPKNDARPAVEMNVSK